MSFLKHFKSKLRLSGTDLSSLKANVLRFYFWHWLSKCFRITLPLRVTRETEKCFVKFVWRHWSATKAVRTLDQDLRKKRAKKMSLAIGVSFSSQDTANFLNKRHDREDDLCFQMSHGAPGTTTEGQSHQGWGNWVNIQGFCWDQKSSHPRVKVI